MCATRTILRPSSGNSVTAYTAKEHDAQFGGSRGYRGTFTLGNVLVSYTLNSQREDPDWECCLRPFGTKLARTASFLEADQHGPVRREVETVATDMLEAALKSMGLSIIDLINANADNEEEA